MYKKYEDDWSDTKYLVFFVAMCMWSLTVHLLVKWLMM
jgi:hypothetical protein